MFITDNKEAERQNRRNGNVKKRKWVLLFPGAKVTGYSRRDQSSENWLVAGKSEAEQKQDSFFSLWEQADMKYRPKQSIRQAWLKELIKQVQSGKND